MDQKTNWWGNYAVAYLITAASFLLIAALAVNKLTHSSINFDLRFNVYSLLSLFSALVDIIIIGLVISRKRFSLMTNWFVLFLIGAAFMALGEGLQRSSIYLPAALFWQDIYYLCFTLLPPVFYLFIVSYVYAGQKKFILLSSVLIFCWGAVGFFIGDKQIFYVIGSHIHHASWGYFSDGTVPYNFTIIWSILFYVLGSGLLIQFFRSNPSKTIKKQVFIFLLAFIAPFLAAVITNVILPSSTPNTVPPLATFVGAFSAMLVYYGIRHYQLFVLDPDLVAQNILDTLNEAVIITRPNTQVESLNLEAARLLGVDQKTTERIKLSDYFTTNAWQEIINHVKKAHGYRIESISKSSIINRSKQEIPVRIAITQLWEEGEVSAYIFVLANISELSKSFDALAISAKQISAQNTTLKELEDQLREEKASVEETVRVRTKELVQAQERLKAADQLKSEFIMLTSHNLRTPITIARGYVDALNRPMTDEERNEALTAVGDSLKRLNQLVEDLLTMSSIEAGDQLNLKEVKLSDVLNPIIPEASELAKAKNIELITHMEADDTVIRANLPMLQGAIKNVLNNACKFTDHGQVELTARDKGDLVKISVSDTGIGIADDELPKLFSKFHRASNVLSGKYEGKGVGLYLAKLIINEHGGTISVQSQLNHGSVFTIELPRR
ncbi:MAG: ATP-binding protein [Candidatus Saccharimonadales bacterium]